jgi:hypothetical protein
VSGEPEKQTVQIQTRSPMVLLACPMWSMTSRGEPDFTPAFTTSRAPFSFREDRVDVLGKGGYVIPHHLEPVTNEGASKVLALPP